LLSKILDGFHVMQDRGQQAMNPMRLRRPLAALVLGGTAAFLGAVLPAHAFSNPPIQVAQGVEYMCGGAAKGEAEFMEMVAPRWAATIELGVSDGKGAQQRASRPRPRSRFARNTPARR
jgi:ABC-type cobalamin transport system permease subunit